MGRLTEFSCPKNKEYFNIIGGSPATLVAFSQPVDHVIVSPNLGSGWVAFDSTATELNGAYIAETRQFDLSMGSISFYTGTAGSINIIGLY